MCILKSLINLIFFSFLSISFAQKYESIQVELDTKFKVPGQIKMNIDLIKRSGRIKHLKAGKNGLRWRKVLITGDNFKDLYRGYVNYSMMNLTGENHKLQFKITLPKYNLINNI